MSDRDTLRPDSVPPKRSAHIALVAASSLCAQAPSREAHSDVVSVIPPDHIQEASKWTVLALSGTAAFMTTLDSSIVNIALPSIAHAFGVSLTGTVEWVLIGYLVVVAAALLTLGRVADMVGDARCSSQASPSSRSVRRCAARRRRCRCSSPPGAFRGSVRRGSSPRTLR